jgi:anaerobic selenocysteine-containing dehydrogenase
MLCDAHCALRVTVEQGRVTRVVGDRDDPLSRGHLCAKAAAIGDLMDHPQRVRMPLRRERSQLVPVSWDDALEDIAARIRALQAEHPDAVGTYLGNPTVHDFAAAIAMPVLRAVLGGRNHYSVASVDNLPRMVASWALYGSPARTPVRDLDRTDLLVMFGANPWVSNGGGMVAPDVRRRLTAIAERGGVVVFDPRRSESADHATAHHFVRPGTDALVLLAMVHCLADGAPPALRQAVEGFSPEAVSERTGVAPGVVRALSERLRAERSVVYGRMGTTVQRFGTATTILLDVVNALAGNLDVEGGAMFCTPAVDLPRVAGWAARGDGLGATRSRVDGLPSFLGEWPLAALDAEIRTPGPGQLRGLVVHGGDPAMAVPGGVPSLSSLDLLVCIDPFVSETARHAHYVLPPTLGFERPHMPLVLAAQGIRDFTGFREPLLPAPPGVRPSWDILLGLAARLTRWGWALRALRRWGAERVVDLALRLGPHRLSLAALRASETTVDLGALRPGRLSKPVPLFPDLLEAAMPALAALRDEPVAGLTVLGRRTTRSVNSWLHRVDRLVRGTPRCVLEVHPDDAPDGDEVWLCAARGRIRVPIRRTDRVMPGVVCLPHGWRHASLNAVLADEVEQSGASVLAGPVWLESC